MASNVIPFPSPPTLWERAEHKRRQAKEQRSYEMNAWCKAMSDLEMVNTETLRSYGVEPEKEPA